MYAKPDEINPNYFLKCIIPKIEAVNGAKVLNSIDASVNCFSPTSQSKDNNMITISLKDSLETCTVG